MLSPPHFPIRRCGLVGRWRFRALVEGDHEIEGFTVTAREIPHKGGRAFGRLVVFHHDPTRTDADIDRIVAEHENCGVKVEAAAETTVIEVRQ